MYIRCYSNHAVYWNAADNNNRDVARQSKLTSTDQLLSREFRWIVALDTLVYYCVLCTLPINAKFSYWLTKWLARPELVQNSLASAEMQQTSLYSRPYFNNFIGFLINGAYTATMSLSCTVNKILSFISQNLKRSWHCDSEHTLFIHSELVPHFRLQFLISAFLSFPWLLRESYQRLEASNRFSGYFQQDCFGTFPEIFWGYLMLCRLQCRKRLLQIVLLSLPWVPRKLQLHI